ncbi:sensor histidine kinase [Corynebacterium sp. LaCa116]|uniref:sensor histidine kinase n=1 Tax=Corynebacterium sp. LaCa116 TaxID=3391423 RepID=UPI003989563B
MLAQPFLAFLSPLAVFMILAIVRWDTPQAMIPQLVALTLYLGSEIWWSHAVKKRLPLTAATWCFAASALVVFLTANNSSSLVVIWLGVVAVVIVQSLRAGIIYGLIPVLTRSAGIHVVAGSSVSRIITETLAAFSLIAIGVFLARLARTAATDAVEKAHRAAELADANEQLRHSIETARELTLSEERGRIAAALHDGLGHRLTAISMSLDFSQRMIAKNPQRAAEEITHARETTIAALDDMRTVVRALHPIRLESEGFYDALTALGNSFSSTALTVEVAVASNAPQLTPLAESFFLAAAQETLTNVVRHSASATTARISVIFDSDLNVITMSVSDNGPGSDDSEAGFGIRSLQERAEALGGRVLVSGHGGIADGFLLSIELPVTSCQQKDRSTYA